jgi:hypothetical protein
MSERKEVSNVYFQKEGKIIINRKRKKEKGKPLLLYENYE